MGKVYYEGIEFDSELEKDYYIHLQEGYKNGEILKFKYHPSQIHNLVGKRDYTPDFIVEYEDRIEVIETKGWNQFTFRVDDIIHNTMLGWNESQLECYCFSNDFVATGKKYLYRKIKYLKAYGFVDYDFKNTNTIANKRKAKIEEQKNEIKELREFKKNAERYFKYHLKLVNTGKLTKQQNEWYRNYVEELKKNYSGECKKGE